MVGEQQQKCVSSFFIDILMMLIKKEESSSIYVILTHKSWRRKWQPTPVLPGESHGQRNQVGCSPWGGKESDTTERLHFHVSLSCIGEGNGNPLQCSCLENPRDGGAWWAAVYGVAQSRTRLKRLSSSSSRETNVALFLCMQSRCQQHPFGLATLSWLC